MGVWAKRNGAGLLVTPCPWGLKLVEVLDWPDDHVSVGPRAELQRRAAPEKLGVWEGDTSSPG